MFRNTVRKVIDGLDKSFKREYARFDEFSDVVGLNIIKIIWFNITLYKDVFDVGLKIKNG